MSCVFQTFCLSKLLLLSFCVLRDAGGDRAASHSHHRDRGVARVASSDCSSGGLDGVNCAKAQI